MFTLSQSVTPAAKTHMEAQLTYFNDMSKPLFRSFQQLCQLNIQLAKTLLEESTLTGQEIIMAKKQTEYFSVVAAHAQPAAEKIRAYQQHLARIAADTRVELAKVSEEHVPKTSDTAKALADEVARAASEETEKSMRKQEDALRNFSDPFDHVGDAMQQRPSGGDGMQGNVNLHSANQSANAGGHEAHGVATP